MLTFQNSNMLVMKFGGTSVEDAVAMQNVINIVRTQQTRQSHPAPMVIVSACAGITNKLIKLAELAATNQRDEALGLLGEISAHHLKIIATLLKSDTKAKHFIEKLTHDLATLITAADLFGDASPRVVDAFAAHGELFSSFILAEAMNEQGIKTEWKDARAFLMTNDHFGKAEPLWSISEAKLKEQVLPLLNEGVVVLSQGYIGATASGKTTTLGRGGSDYSAAIFGAMLDAEAIQIWTDVDGVLTADPRLVPDARRLKVMTFNEAAELAYSGAKVLHPSTIRPAVAKNIPVYVLNSKSPLGEGTLITNTVDSFEGMVKSIAHKKGQTIINLTTTQMLGTFGFLRQVAQVFEKYETAIDMISTSEVSISLTIGDKTNLNKIVAELERIAEVEIEKNIATISVVGDSIRRSPGIAARVFQAVSEINVKMISQGASEINIGFAVDESDMEKAVRLLHNAFFAEVKEGAIFA
ncbi:MAG: lysine-sensitive aspartokinase 3 [Chloroherpetonaceae bacterium]